jgi:hypothetical protein
MLAVFLAVAACCSGARAEDVFSASITIRGHKFEPSELHAPAGRRIVLTVINADPPSELCHEDVETSCCVTDEGRPFGAAL